ncbi:hypothetical protein Patl1_18267 [Pistacia atlantica]|uniref:Uncharacterized protein n=1 Tax=Pistacia atlantica TaxID=434234 RepID=A0ACC1C1N0_9ROSI|nr:hypothetical protein Patl1_18267 [Pistacia atlantica]
MDLYYETNWNCVDDSTKYNQRLEKKCVFDFLEGLNPNLDEVWGRILATKPLPSARNAFVEVHREESHRRVMLSSSRMNSASQAFALATQSARNPKTASKQWRDHCILNYAIVSSILPQDVWVIDTGASDHVTGSISMLTVFEPCPTNSNVFVVDEPSLMVEDSEEPSPMVEDSEIGNEEQNGFNIPIAIRKRVRSCTQYPIANHVTFSKLSN